MVMYNYEHGVMGAVDCIPMRWDRERLTDTSLSSLTTRHVTVDITHLPCPLIAYSPPRGSPQIWAGPRARSRMHFDRGGHGHGSRRQTAGNLDCWYPG